MRRWIVIAAAFCAGLAALVAGFSMGGDGIACEVSGQGCSAGGIAEELVYAGFALLAVALLSAVVTVARRA